MRKIVGRVLSAINPIRLIRRGIFALTNWRRSFQKIDYVLFTLPQEMPPLTESRGFFRERVLGKSPMSLTELNRIFERIGDDPRPKGVILNLRGLHLSLANLQTLRGIILRLRAKGKRVICFAQNYDNATYFIASAADEIVLQPGGEVAALGLRAQAVFLKDALDTLGVQMDAVAISPFKNALDMFTRRDMSQEGAAQLNWLLDSQYEILVGGIAEGRKWSIDEARGMIDSGPHLDDHAVAAGYVDAVETEENLQRRLKSEHIIPWAEADKKLFKKWHKSSDKYVALLRVGGTMMQGESGKPPVDIPLPFVGDERAGDITIVQQVRGLMKNKSAAAVILYVDSPGGDANAAEAMTSALSELAKDRPLIVYMNSVAASGGYYVATPAKWIVAQPGTVTGSIGVFSAKPVTNGLFERLRVHRTELARGTNAGYLSDSAPFTDAQRERMRQTITHIYDQFVGRVAQGRNMSAEAVDAIGGGRVWTGAQAKENGLVDELGDLYTALAKARSLANLSEDAPLVIVPGKHKNLPAQLAEQANPAAMLPYLQSGVVGLCSGQPLALMPFEWK
ncbi:MAG: S49 family peptidase [Chloroflexota bacterium]